MIASHDGTGMIPNTSINNYLLAYATNVPSRVLSLRGAHVPATLDTDLAYEFGPAQGPGELYVAMPPEFGLSPGWIIYGTVTDPTFQTTLLANWWVTRGASEFKMATTFPAIAFDFSSQVSVFTSRGHFIGALICSNEIASFPLSFRRAIRLRR